MVKQAHEISRILFVFKKVGFRPKKSSFEISVFLVWFGFVTTISSNLISPINIFFGEKDFLTIFRFRLISNETFKNFRCGTQP